MGEELALREDREPLLYSWSVNATKSVVLGLALTCGCSGDVDVLVARPNESLLLAMSEERPTSPEEWRNWQEGVMAGELDGFAGAVLDLGFGAGGFGSQSLDAQTYTPTVAIVGATATRFAHHFQLLSLSGEPPPWTSDEFFAQATLYFETAARLAREAGMTGLFIDNQSYGPPIFALPAEGGLSLAEWEPIVRQRGAEVMAALLRGFPGATVMLAWAYAEMFREVCVAGNDLAAHPYALYPAFLDGMRQVVRQSSPSARLLDGYLPAYPARDPAHFPLFAALVAHDEAKVERLWRPDVVTHWDDLGRLPGPVQWPARYTRSCSDAVAKRLQHPLEASFGLMVDYVEEAFPRTLAASGPAAVLPFAPALASALRASTSYVWLYADSAEWVKTKAAVPKVSAETMSDVAAARQAAAEDPLGPFH